MVDNSVDEALRAWNEWKVDVIVAQGVEAGGHGSSHSPPILNFIPAVRAALPQATIVAAGGVATGAQVAALLTLGADGVVCGTRFLFTPESCYTEQMKNVLVKSTWESTERSNAYDQAFQTDFWPSHVDGRAICTNDVMKDFKAGLPLEERINRFKEATAAGKDSHLIMWAGTGVAQTNEIKPAAVRRLIPRVSSDTDGLCRRCSLRSTRRPSRPSATLARSLREYCRYKIRVGYRSSLYYMPIVIVRHTL